MSNIRSFVAHFIAVILLVCPVILGAAASPNVVANGPAAQTGAATSTAQFESAQYYLKTPDLQDLTAIYQVKGLLALTGGNYKTPSQLSD